MFHLYGKSLQTKINCSEDTFCLRSQHLNPTQLGSVLLLPQECCVPAGVPVPGSCPRTCAVASTPDTRHRPSSSTAASLCCRSSDCLTSARALWHRLIVIRDRIRCCFCARAVSCCIESSRRSHTSPSSLTTRELRLCLISSSTGRTRKAENNLD